MTIMHKANAKGQYYHQCWNNNYLWHGKASRSHGYGEIHRRMMGSRKGELEGANLSLRHCSEYLQHKKYPKRPVQNWGDIYVHDLQQRPMPPSLASSVTVKVVINPNSCCLCILSYNVYLLVTTYTTNQSVNLICYSVFVTVNVFLTKA